MTSRPVPCPRSAIALLTAILALPLPAPAEQAARAQAQPAERQSALSEGKQSESEGFRPPMTGLPRTVGGAVRGTLQRGLDLAVLAPAETARTASPRPTLYWYARPGLSQPLELVVLADDANEPLVQRTLAPPPREGLQAIALGDLGVSLTPGRDYAWSIALVNDPLHPSTDTVSMGRLRYEPLSPALEQIAGQPEQLSGPEGLERGFAFYAGQGYWYDALHLLAGAMTDDDPKQADPVLRSRLLSLLRQAALPELAQTLSP